MFSEVARAEWRALNAAEVAEFRRGTTEGNSMELIQAAQFTGARRRSDTELARIVASGQGWQFDDDDQVCDSRGKRIAFTIEDLANYGREAGWFARSNAGIVWGAVDVHSDVAATVRQRLDARGRFL